MFDFFYSIKHSLPSMCVCEREREREIERERERERENILYIHTFAYMLHKT